jgi:hypothetical protein
MLRVITLVCCLAVVAPPAPIAELVPVRHIEGLLHGFLKLSTLDGVILANGDLFQEARGDRVTTRVAFRFKDGSTHDETAVFSQRQVFRLVSNHLVQKGPAFPQPIDMTVITATGQVTVKYIDDHGDAKVAAERMKLPADIANGVLLTLLKNIRPGDPTMTVGLVAATPQPRLVKVVVTAAGDDAFSTGGLSRIATHYVAKVELGGVAGLIAPIVGKQPPDTHVWILHGEAPAFVKMEGPLSAGGPVWRIELVSPIWPKQP